MALKYIDSAWKRDMRTNYAHRFNFYINPRCRVLPALTSTGVSYVRNTSGADNMRGTFRLQAGASTSLTYLYTMPQRFIVEGWIKPEFAYDVAGNQTLFQCGDAAEFSIIYNATTDKIDMIQSPGTTISTRAFTATTDLYAWLYIRAWYDNVGKLAGLYIVKNGEELVATQNVPGAGSFVPLNTISFFPGVACQSSYWCIHELDETLATGAWKTYQADRQIMFDFNGTTLARERIRIPVNHETTDTRGVKSFSLSKSVSSPMSGNPCANTATMTLYNVNGQFSDDQYDAFDPFQGRYNGTQKYLQNRVGVEIESQYICREFLYPSSTLYPSASLYPRGPLNTSAIEPVFIGRTTPGAFKRTSESRYFGTVTVEAEDGISELGETRLPKAYTFDTFDLSDPASESTSLFHSIARLVTKKEIRNFALNSSFENATIGNSWTASGLTLTRDSTYAQFGTYAAKAVAGSAGQYFRQVVKFEGTDKIDVGDTFNFSAFVRQGTASTVKVQIEELDSSGTLLGSASETACGTDTGVFTRVSVSRTILYPILPTDNPCTQLRITLYATGASTFYVDGVMLTRGIDALDYFLANATDGASGSGSADSAATYLYDTVAIDAEAVDVSVPWAELEKGDTPWSHLKDIGDASLASYVGMEPDGVLSFRVRYNSQDEDNNGSVADIASIGTSLDATSINSVDVRGVQTAKEPWTMQLYSAYTSGQWVDTTGTGMTAGGRLYYPIADGTLCTVNGSSVIECPYVDGGGPMPSWTPK